MFLTDRTFEPRNVRSTKTSSHWARGNAGEQNCHVWEGRFHAFPPKTPGGGEEGKERGWNVGEVWTGAHYIEFQATPMYGCLVLLRPTFELDNL